MFFKKKSDPDRIPPPPLSCPKSHVLFRPAAADSRGGLHHRGNHLHRGGGADLPDAGALQGRVADPDPYPDSIGSVDPHPDPGGQK
jgi:hypothetical protein